MNTKAAIGILVAIIILVGAFFFANQKVAAPVLTPTTATSTLATTTQAVPSSSVAAPASVNQPSTAAPAVGAAAAPKRQVTVDNASLTSTSPRPTITGTATANITSIGYVLDNPQGVGIAGASDIPVVNGKWQFTPPLMLKPGTYTLHIIGGGSTTGTFQLVVKGS